MKNRFPQRQNILASFILLVLILGITAGLVSAAPGDTTRISVDTSGIQGNNSSEYASLSADGRFVVFESFANNLVPGDTNGERDVFVHDRTDGTTTRVSVDSSGIQANNPSEYPSISADGRYVVFESSANNLVPGDTNGTLDIFVHDRTGGVTTRVSVDSSGVQGNGYSGKPSISADGRYVAFYSYANNLVPGDTNGVIDIFVRDRTDGTTTRVSMDSSGGQGNEHSFYPSISADGRYVVFESAANNLVSGDTNGEWDIFLHDRTGGTTTRVSLDSSGVQGNNNSFYASISADGRYVVFQSYATNLVVGDTNGTGDVYFYDRTLGATTRVSVTSSGVQGNSNSINPFISADGRYVVFESAANNLVSGDTNTQWDVFVYDRIGGVTTRVSVDSSGVQGNSFSEHPSISANGLYVVLSSNASNLVAGDTNAWPDIFVHETGTPATGTTTVLSDSTDLPKTGFAPGQITTVGQASVAYFELLDQSDRFELVIPALGLKNEIVGVPYAADDWDVTGLGDAIGFLEGSAFPTQAGNTVLTGHVWDANNQPGVFANLKTLSHDDRILINARGITYSYAVRENRSITNHDMDAVFKHEELDWITLVTCEDYDPTSGEYLFRRMVRAVLVGVD